MMLAVLITAFLSRHLLSWPPTRPDLTPPFVGFRQTPFAPLRLGSTPSVPPMLRRSVAAKPSTTAPARTFESVVEDLREAERNIFVNWRELDRAGVDRSATVTLDVAGKSLGQAISDLLIATRSTKPLGFTVDGREIVISTEEDLSSNVTTIVYDARSLLRSEATRNEPLKWLLGTTDERLQSHIKQAIDFTPNVARNFRMLSGQLIVTTIPENQAMIAYQLGRMRWWNDSLRFALRCIAAGIAAIATITFATWLFRRRIKPGCCVKCGYDLRASPERCPECGTAVTHDGLEPARTSPVE
jgi:hypothetical protein